MLNKYQNPKIIEQLKTIVFREVHLDPNFIGFINLFAVIDDLITKYNDYKLLKQQYFDSILPKRVAHLHTLLHKYQKNLEVEHRRYLYENQLLDNQQKLLIDPVFEDDGYKKINYYDYLKKWSNFSLRSIILLEDKINAVNKELSQIGSTNNNFRISKDGKLEFVGINFNHIYKEINAMLYEFSITPISKARLLKIIQSEEESGDDEEFNLK